MIKKTRVGVGEGTEALSDRVAKLIECGLHHLAFEGTAGQSIHCHFLASQASSKMPNG